MRSEPVLSVVEGPAGNPSPRLGGVGQLVSLLEAHSGFPALPPAGAGFEFAAFRYESDRPRIPYRENYLN